MKKEILKLLIDFKSGSLSVEDTFLELKKIMNEPSDSLTFADIDWERKKRTGFPEVIFGEGKTPQQLMELLKVFQSKKENFLATRVSKEKMDFLREKGLDFDYDEPSQTLVHYMYKPIYLGKIAVVSAGTSDFKVASEAVRVAEFFGLQVTAYQDIGVAGLHRLLNHLPSIQEHEVILCVAGMEGALVSVLAGLVDKPVIAVPSGISYGAGSGGITTLLSMINSCASGVSVVNIANGFGASYMAATICRQIRLASGCNEKNV